MILGSDQGAVVTRNGGETWSSWYNQPAGQFYHVATDSRFLFWVYGAHEDRGGGATRSRSKYRSLNFHDWRPMNAGDENGYIAPDPLNPEIVYGGTVARQDLRNEQIVHVPSGLGPTEKLRHTWTLPLVFSPLDALVLYFGSQKLFRTADGGNSWQAISPDLTREDPGVPVNLDAPTAADAPGEKRRGVIYTIGASSVQAGEIWAGTDDGLIQLTLDEGRTWSNVTPAELTPWSKLTQVEASHFDAGTAYAAVDRHRLEDLHAYLYRTRDFGKSWQQASSGIPEGSFLNCVREDPLRKGLLYACTELGVYVSFNDGDSWQSLQLNMPASSVRDLVVHGDDLVIATHGRSFWILDDVISLRQMNPQVTAADLWLFKPATAYRVRPGSDEGTPVPMDEPLAENPPDGAVVDYWLKDKAKGPVALEIFDANGELGRRFSSDDSLPKTNPKDTPIAMEWVRDAAPLSAEAEMHRFVWDLHYALPKSVHRSFYGPAGVWSLPGNYVVKLTANGKSTSQPLTVKMDPRISAPEDALRREFVAGSPVLALLGGGAGAQPRAGGVQGGIGAREGGGGGEAGGSRRVGELARRLSEVNGAQGEEEFGFFGLKLPPAEPGTLHKVAAALTGLLMIVDRADPAPSADAQRAAEQWEAAGADVVARWKTVEGDLAGVNAALEKAKFQPVAP